MSKLIAVSGYNRDLIYINEDGEIIDTNIRDLWQHYELLQTIALQTLEEGTWRYDATIDKYTHSFSGLDVTPKVYSMITYYKARQQRDKVDTISTNDTKGKQSFVPYRYDLLDPHAMQCLTNILYQGANAYQPSNYENVKHDENWRKISTRSHINHAMAHIVNYLNDSDREELTHAFCRLMFAVAQSKENK